MDVVVVVKKKHLKMSHKLAEKILGLDQTFNIKIKFCSLTKFKIYRKELQHPRFKVLR